MTPFAPFPHARPRRLRRTPWIRDLVAEHRLTPADLIWPIFVRDGFRPRRAGSVPARRLPPVDRPGGPRRRGGRRPRHPLPGAVPLHRRRRQEPRSHRSLEPRQSRVPRHPRHQGRRARGRHPARRRAGPLQLRRPRRPGPRRRDPQRRNPARAREDGARPGRGRLRHPRALRHDGRPHRRDPRARWRRTTSPTP